MASMRTLAVAAVAAVAAIAVGAAPAAAAVATDPLTVYSSSRSTPLAATPPPKPLSPGRRTRIVGGRTVTDVDPETGSQFVAKIFTADGAGFYCGGSFVSASHVLTRAGCRVVVGDVVRVGGAKLWDGLWYRVKEVKNHPAYDPAGDVNDLAVLVLANPKSESEMLAAGVVPVKITTDFGSPHGFYVSGFGATDNAAQGAGSLQLKRGYQPLRPWRMCREIMDSVLLSDGTALPIHESAQVCTNYKSNWSGALCERDVGGGMFRADDKWVNGTQVKEYTLFAVSSYWIGTRSAVCPQGYPNVGTKLSFYADWIRQAMK